MGFVYMSPKLAESNREKIRLGKGVWGTIRDELRFCGDKHLTEDQLNDFHSMGTTICILANAGYYLDEPKYFEQAKLILTRWFLDPTTAITLHFEPGNTTEMISVLTAMCSIIHSLGFLEQYPGCKALVEEMKSQMRQMSNLLRSEPDSLYASWQNTFLASCAAYFGDEETFENCVAFFKAQIISNQVLPTGEMPSETSHTRSLYYSLSNTDALSLMCELAWQKGIDLWNWKTPQGVGMADIAQYLRPHLENIFTWPHSQITGDIIDDKMILQYAALRMGMADCIPVNNKLRRDRYLAREQAPIGPLALLEGFETQYSAETPSWM